MLGSSDRAAYLDSLALLRELKFDVLVPWRATSGQPTSTSLGTLRRSDTSTRSLGASRRAVDWLLEVEDDLAEQVYFQTADLLNLQPPDSQKAELPENEGGEVPP